MLLTFQTSYLAERTQETPNQTGKGNTTKKHFKQVVVALPAFVGLEGFEGRLALLKMHNGKFDAWIHDPSKKPQSKAKSRYVQQTQGWCESF